MMLSQSIPSFIVTVVLFPFEARVGGSDVVVEMLCSVGGCGRLDAAMEAMESS